MECTSTFLRAPAEIPPEPAQNPSNPANSTPCCAGIDFPGLGFVHSAICPVSPDQVQRFGRTTVPGRPYVAGEVPDPLRVQLRAELLIALIFAARNLALENIAQRAIVVGIGRETRCSKCQMTAVGGDLVVHTASCNTGRVLGLIAQLTQESTLASNSPAEERGESNGGCR